MKLKDLLLENPMIIDRLDDYPLNDISKNRDRYNLFMQYAKRHLFDYSNINVYHTIVAKQNIIVGLNVPGKKIAYYCSFERVKIPVFNNACSQMMVWADSRPETKGLPRHIFFDYFLKQFDTIVSDYAQTEYGKKFWENNIRVAFEKNLYVYVYFTSSMRLKRIENYKDFLNVKGDLWGEDFAYGDIVLAISKKNLHDNTKTVD